MNLKNLPVLLTPKSSFIPKKATDPWSPLLPPQEALITSSRRLKSLPELGSEVRNLGEGLLGRVSIKAPSSFE